MVSHDLCVSPKVPLREGPLNVKRISCLITNWEVTELSF